MPWTSIIELSVVEGPDAPLTVKSTGGLSIGRAGHCDLSLTDPGASREHAMVEREGDDFVLVDLGTANGTFVGAEKSKVSRHNLRDGDQIRVGQSTLKVSIRRRGQATDVSPSPERPPRAPAARDVPPPAPSIALTVVGGPDRGKTFELPELGRVQIGRLPTCDVRLNDRLISRLHATIRREGSGYAIYDENSANGLEVGTPPEKVSYAKLEDGMNLRLGLTEIQVKVSDARTAAADVGHRAHRTGLRPSGTNTKSLVNPIPARSTRA